MAKVHSASAGMNLSQLDVTFIAWLRDIPLDQECLKLAERCIDAEEDARSRDEGRDIGEEIAKTCVEDESVDGFPESVVEGEGDYDEDSSDDTEDARNSLCNDDQVSFTLVEHHDGGEDEGTGSHGCR